MLYKLEAATQQHNGLQVLLQCHTNVAHIVSLPPVAVVKQAMLPQCPAGCCNACSPHAELNKQGKKLLKVATGWAVQIVPLCQLAHINNATFLPAACHPPAICLVPVHDLHPELLAICFVSVAVTHFGSVGATQLCCLWALDCLFGGSTLEAEGLQ